uniref:Reverse transcriptase zinc-binding domain-containing protein n=1 Tax=Brassica oleracea var. oleracea TaxID=109376 RepID=A0A0D3CT93_BRAOL
SSASHDWRGIIEGRKIILQHLGKVIGNGNSTKLWHAPWLSASTPTVEYSVIQIFLWKVLQNAIPTGENLQKRRVLTNTTCVRCGVKETTLHLFFHCEFTKQLRAWRLELRCSTPLLSDSPTSGYTQILKSSFEQSMRNDDRRSSSGFCRTLNPCLYPFLSDVSLSSPGLIMGMLID